ncbi:MAG: hypothetical protein IKP86_01105 [Anaerolineaceae bacterium]|nr:hypothetical protein [Anaerolineaceae bacterium]
MTTDPKVLQEQVFEDMVRRAAEDFAGGVFRSKIEIIYSGGSSENGPAIETAEMQDAGTLFAAEHTQTVTGLSISDAMAHFDPDDSQLVRGIFEPGSGGREPLMMSVWFSLPGGGSDDTFAVLYLFSCVPGTDIFARGVGFRTDKNTRTVSSIGMPVTENIMAIRTAWMRIMWGANRMFEYEDGE